MERDNSVYTGLIQCSMREGDTYDGHNNGRLDQNT